MCQSFLQRRSFIRNFGAIAVVLTQLLAPIARADFFSAHTEETRVALQEADEGKIAGQGKDWTQLRSFSRLEPVNPLLISILGEGIAIAIGCAHLFITGFLFALSVFVECCSFFC